MKNSLGIDKPAHETRVVVAMSGGVDSSVTAALLKQEGYDVIGITLQLYDHGLALQKKGACCAGQDIYDAKRVADKIGIPHYILDYESRFQDAVMEDFADSYMRGETPIPCVRCNQTVKFHDLLTTARDLGGEALATGHYIQRKTNKHGQAELHRALDASKDQSYFLFATTQEQLDYLRFPLGGLSKDQTRELAGRFALAVAEKPDSQDICFVPNGSYAKVVERLRPGAVSPGDIVDMTGKVIGRHEGIIHYTIGQRRGLGIGGMDEPLHVVSIEADTNRIVVGPREALARNMIHIKEMNWLGDEVPDKQGRAITVKLRSTHTPVGATIYGTDGDETKAVVFLNSPEYGISPGQAAVFYDGTQVLGGGWMTAAAYHQEKEVLSMAV